MPRPLVLALCAAAGAAAAAALALPAAASAADPGPYVALGDSFTSAPLVLNQVGQPLGCARADHNYPSLVAAATGAAPFVDRSCGAATTVNMTAPQAVALGTNPPQFDGLRADAGLVTIGIGGNDVGLVGAAVRCVELGALAPTGTACRSAFAKPGGGDVLADQIAATGPRIAATLQGIHARAPRARVLLVGYPAVGADDGTSCYPLVTLSGDDMAYLVGMLRKTNEMLAAQAAANDAEFVDTYQDSIGHDVCTPIGTRWFEGVVPTSPAFPIHPNALGEASMARSVLRVLGQPRPGPVLGALRRSRKSIAPGRTLRVTFDLSRPATVALGLQRSRGAGRYTRLRGLATIAANAGTTTVTLSPRNLGRRPGLYRLTAALPDGSVQRAQFRIRHAR